MPTKIIGLTVGADEAHVVVLTKNDNGDYIFEDQTCLKLQEGDRPAAYNTIHGQFMDYVEQRQVQCVCIKGSAVSLGGTKLVHLHAAELRGVIQTAAAAAGTQVKLMTKAAASRNFGTRKVDEYLKDDDYWNKCGLADVKKGMREAAFVAISLNTKGQTNY